MALDFAARGAVVTGLARRADLLESVTSEMQTNSPKSGHLVCDVSDTSRFVSVLEQIEHDHGRIDVLVNNAGIGDPSDGKDLAGYRAVMETNYLAPVAGTLAVLPGMRARGRGVVLNVSSDIARAPSRGETAYAASKAALTAFTESLSFELEGTGVHVHLLYPGWVPTGMTATDTPENMPPKFVRRTEHQVSAAVLASIGGPRVDINLAPIARLAPVARELVPGLYRRAVKRATS